MYKLLKKTISNLLPRTFIIKNELAFRSVFAFFYNGSSHHCTICHHKLKSFVTLEQGDLLCPFCGSLSRTRRLWNILNNDAVITGNVLHFSPSRSLYRKLSGMKNINYYSSDFENEFLADYQYDITAIAQTDDTFDLIICYHILEHIEEDTKAMSELYRVLKPRGTLYVQTPLKEGHIYENESIKTPEGRLEHFGQEDHVRIYSVTGLKTRLEETGFKVNVLTFQSPEEEDDYLGLLGPETVIKLTK